MERVGLEVSGKFLALVYIIQILPRAIAAEHDLK
jgi:hypothetical protein